jgi:tetratricopeptide (TPR) repeat protein
VTPQQLMAAADAAYDVGRFAAAAALYARLMAVAPDHPLPLFNYAAARRDGGDPAGAWSWLRRTARLSPDHEQVRRAAAAAAMSLRKWQAAQAHALAASVLEPAAAENMQIQADTAKALGDAPRAVALYRRALRVEPPRAGAWFNLGVAHADACDHARAVFAQTRAVALAPADGAARFNLAYELLTAGRLAEGFRAYESRFHHGQERPAHPLPWWRGEPLAGRRILLFAEQGHGDGVHFARYALPAAQAGAGAVGIEAPPALIRLLATVPGVSRVHALGTAPTGEYDLFCPLMSLPHLFHTDLTTISAQIPYVADCYDEDGRFDRLFDPDDRRLRVGLVWSGDPRPHDPRHFDANRRRSLTLEQLAPLLETPGIAFYSLQAGEARAELTESPFAGEIIDPMGEVRDFADTAGLIRRLDLVISVCTATAHLAGALGKPLWLPLARRACWRWLSDREDSPWYPSARLFRQTVAGDWSPVVAAMRLQLHENTLPRRPST